MKATTLSKSRFKVALECPRKLVYSTDPRYANSKDSDDLLKALAEWGHQVGALAKLMHPGGIEITAASPEEQIRETERLLQQEEITLFEPTFRSGNLLVRVDVLVKHGQDIKLIEVKSKGFDPDKDSFRAKKSRIEKAWRPYLYDVAFQTLVLEDCHPEWRVTPFLMLLDTSATASLPGVGAQFEVKHHGRRVEVATQPGFDPSLLKAPLLKAHDVSEEVRVLRGSLVETPAGEWGFKDLVDWLAGHLAEGEPFQPFTGSQCKKCEFYCDPAEHAENRRSGWAECLALTYHREIIVARAESVFGLYKHAKSAALLRADRIALAEVSPGDIEFKDEPGSISLSQRHALQIEEAKGEGEALYLEVASLRDAMGAWQYPLHFIDFETARPALPFHLGRKPNELILFQFSHHMLDESGRLSHVSQCLEATPGEDPSISVVRALRHALAGNQGTVIHWWDHEKTVLKALRERINIGTEEDREDLLAFVDNMTGEPEHPGRLADLGKLISKTAFIKGTNGRSSIKKVLPAVLEQSDYLQQRYGQAIYGSSEMTSLNFPEGWIWLKKMDGHVLDPYKLLDPLPFESEIQDAIENGDDEDEGSQEFIANGGAAMIAYGKLQRPDLEKGERQNIEAQLKRYCELDTLAMVMVYEAIRKQINA